MTMFLFLLAQECFPCMKQHLLYSDSESWQFQEPFCVTAPLPLLCVFRAKIAFMDSLHICGEVDSGMMTFPGVTMYLESD